MLSAGTLAKAGYTFSGWNTEPDGSGTSYAPGDTFTILASTEFFAVWATDDHDDLDDHDPAEYDDHDSSTTYDDDYDASANYNHNHNHSATHDDNNNCNSAHDNDDVHSACDDHHYDRAAYDDDVTPDDIGKPVFRVARILVGRLGRWNLYSGFGTVLRLRRFTAPAAPSRRHRAYERR